MASNRLNKLLNLRQSQDTWLITVRRAPFWIMPKKQPSYRPFLILVADQDTEFILKVDTLKERPTPETVLEHLYKTMQGTLLNLGRNGRPARVFIDDPELTHAIAPGLAELSIRCDYRGSLPQVDAALLEMETQINKRKPIPGLLSIPGVSVPQVADLYLAAADFYRQSPWRGIENFEPIEIHYPPEGRARYALVLGSGGEIFGLSLYESLADLDVIFERTDPDQPLSRPISWLSLVLDEATAMSIADLDAIEQYKWPVAGEKAYPLTLKATSKNDWGELPSALELAWLAASLRVIPDFVTRHLHTESGLPRPATATYPLPGVHGNQQIMLRSPAQTASRMAGEISSIPSFALEQDAYLQELEAYIEDWYWNDASHEFSRQMGTFLFQFLDHLEASGLSKQTISKHERNCWCIGWLECRYGDHNAFRPDIFVGGPLFLTEFKQKVSDTHYAVNSFQATWRKLERYVISLENDKHD